MAEVKWIKLATSIFDNRKIRQIESLPEGATIIVIWLKLLCLAGNINDTGMVYFTKEIPYTDQMLATQFNTPLPTMKLALKTFESFGMIEVIDNILHISNWEKYQNIEGLDKIREQNRIRQANYKAKQKLLKGNVTGNVTVTEGNATDKEKEEEKDSDIKSSSSTTTAATENVEISVENLPEENEELLKIGGKLGKGVVFLTESQIGDLLEKMTLDEYEEYVERLANWIIKKDAKVGNHYKTILKWWREDKQIEGGSR